MFLSIGGDSQVMVLDNFPGIKYVKDRISGRSNNPEPLRERMDANRERVEGFGSEHVSPPEINEDVFPLEVTTYESRADVTTDDVYQALEHLERPVDIEFGDEVTGKKMSNTGEKSVEDVTSEDVKARLDANPISVQLAYDILTEHEEFGSEKASAAIGVVLEAYRQKAESDYNRVDGLPWEGSNLDRIKPVPDRVKNTVGKLDRITEIDLENLQAGRDRPDLPMIETGGQKYLEATD